MSARDEAAGGVGLLPCPFCGGKAHIERYGTPRQSTIYECNSCGCRLETGEEWGHGQDWNTRSPSPRDQASSAMLGALEDAQKLIGELSLMISQAEHASQETRQPNAWEEIGNLPFNGFLASYGMQFEHAISLARSAGIETEENG